jgi:hypothetical protein
MLFTIEIEPKSCSWYPVPRTAFAVTPSTMIVPSTSALE